MFLKDRPIELETEAGPKMWTKNSYICDQEIPCMVIDYIYDGDKNLVDINIQYAQITYYNESNWVQHKAVGPCSECKEELNRVKHASKHLVKKR